MYLWPDCSPSNCQATYPSDKISKNIFEMLLQPFSYSVNSSLLTLRLPSLFRPGGRTRDLQSLFCLVWNTLTRPSTMWCIHRLRKANLWGESRLLCPKLHYFKLLISVDILGPAVSGCHDTVSTDSHRLHFRLFFINLLQNDTSWIPSFLW